jgi:TatA/E family protein of Tat protein translocase
MPFPNIGAPELIIILIIALVVLGPGKLPDVAASLGKSLREFRKAATDVSDAAKVDVTPTASTSVPSTTPGPSTPVAPIAPVSPVAPLTTPADTARVPDSAATTPVEPARDPNLS